MRLCLFAFLLAGASFCPASESRVALPIYLEDNHAGSFYWLARQLDLEEPCTLLQFDAHSDASAIFDSDKLRTALRRVHSLGERIALLERWRAKGVIQCFNWIEPLMPSPVAEAIWVRAARLSTEERISLAEEMARQFDGHLEAAPRAAGTFRGRARVVDLEELEANFVPSRPVIVSIDLDYFAGMAAQTRAAEFERIWDFVSKLRDLRAITIAISRPYLASDEEADALLQLALRSALSLPTARLEFEPFARVANDRSLRAQEFHALGRDVPAFDLARASQELRALLLANRERIILRSEEARWNELLTSWSNECPVPRLQVKNHQPSTDNIWRVAVDEAAEVEIVEDEPGDVQWIIESPRELRCNLDGAANAAAFARDAPPRPRWRETILPAKGRTLPLETVCGAERIKARVHGKTYTRETPTIELRRFRGCGFRAALTEQFGLPYLFGSGALNDGTSRGPETGIGADCANFLVYALRRQGLRIPWSNPKQLRRFLEPIRTDVTLEEAPPFSAQDLERGVVLHLGSHVAALMEDRPPLGRLNADDIVAHQLEGAPQLITAGELLQSRGRSRFDLLRVPENSGAFDFMIGGDVMLGRSVGAAIKNGVDPFAEISSLLHRAPSIVNLECVISESGTPKASTKFPLRAPLAAAEILKAAGCQVIGLANNHANDFGREALIDSENRLRGAGLSVIGANEATCITTPSGRRVAVLAVNELGGEVDKVALAAAIERAKAQTSFVVALVHWGIENTPFVTDHQREFARWMIDHGVDLIAGAHPHCRQPLDFYHGRPIVYSLGNLIFDGAPSVAQWNLGNLLAVSLTNNSRACSLQFIPVKLDARGFPRPSSRSETAAQLADRSDIPGD